ncbi:MAG: hypothetical protein GEU83_01920 [Pseudonocardiaceae bacterium]|nr:hypothetical protein [Pseudonocardiaceae bacterium]
MPLDQSGATVEPIVRTSVEPPTGESTTPSRLDNGHLPAGTEPQSSRPYGSVWRFAVGEQLAWLDSLIGKRADPPPRTVVEAIAEARHAVTAGRDHTLQRAMAWWSGWDAERAWRSLHAAEVELVTSSADLAARLPGIEHQVARECPPADPRLRALEAVRKKVQDDPRASMQDDDRVTVAEAMRAAFAAADDALTGVRNLRNRMLVFGTMLGALNLLLAIFAAVWPGWVPLCGERACPSGPGTAPAGADVVTVQMFGGLGALLAVVILLVHSKPGLLTYQLPGYLSFVKITLGSTLAVVGVLGLIAADVEVVIGSQAALLVAALVFGYAQQVATRFLDDYAEQLVGKAKTGADVSRAGRT